MPQGLIGVITVGSLCTRSPASSRRTTCPYCPGRVLQRSATASHDLVLGGEEGVVLPGQIGHHEDVRTRGAAPVDEERGC